MKKLKAGWVERSVQEFLDLSDADMAYIETKRALAACLRQYRMKKHLTQTMVADRLNTSQSRVARMEAGDRTVMLVLLIQSLFRLGATRRQVASMLAPPWPLDSMTGRR